MNRFYLQAGVFAVLIFLIGIMIGIWIDNSRLDSVRSSLTEADVNSNDARLLSDYLNRFSKDYCNVALNQNLAYNNKIYQEGKTIEQKIDANVFTPDIQQEWKRYTLLQMQFWLNSMELKDKCNFDYHTVVQLFRKTNTTAQEEVDTKVQSAILLDMKEKCGRKMMLIPITVDNNLVSVDAIVNQFKIKDYPAVIVDESYVFQQLTSADTLHNILNC